MKAHPIDLEQLNRQLRSLITLAPNDAPIVSCYLSCSAEREPATELFERRAATLQVLAAKEADALDEALDWIRSYLATRLEPSTRGVAMFARGGSEPIFVPMQFQVPVPDHVSANAMPDVYHLVELKDTYHRYVVLIVSEQSARIIEVNLGAVTRDAWSKYPALRERVRDEWAHEHYQNHRRHRGQRFLEEKLRLLDKLTAAGGHTHLILAGDPDLTAQVRAALPPHLQDKLIDILPLSATASTEDVVGATLASFIEEEHRESSDAVTQLVAGLWRGGLVVAGTQRTIDALGRGRADVLILASEYPSKPAWSCPACDWIDTLPGPPGVCSVCASTVLQCADRKELIVQLAERRGVEVEIVQGSEALLRVGGVGCLLRYALDEWDPTSGPEVDVRPQREP